MLFNKYKIAGVDEVGRGCLAGPVFAAAVILNKSINKKYIKDSKKISFKKRILLSKYIKKNSMYAIGMASVDEIEKINILNASLLSMKRALNKLKLNPSIIYIDGPFGAPTSQIFRAQHAVLIGTGIGVTPFASILQSIMHRYWQARNTCPKCHYNWTSDLSASVGLNLRKVNLRDLSHMLN